MTTSTRKEIAQAFQRAARSLEMGRHAFICHALESQHTKAANKARAIVRRRLAPYDTYGNWLEATQSKEDFRRYCRLPQTIPRLYWLKALIKEFSA